MRGDAPPEPGGGGVLLLEGDLPDTRMQREQRLRGRAPHALPAHRAHDEELEHQLGPARHTTDEAESDRSAVDLEQVGAPVAVHLEERLERPRVEEPAAVGARAAELRQVVPVQLPEPLENMPRLGGQRLQRRLGGHALDPAYVSRKTISCAPSQRNDRPSSRRCSLPSTIVAKWFPASWPAFDAKLTYPYASRISVSDTPPG